VYEKVLTAAEVAVAASAKYVAPGGGSGSRGAGAVKRVLREFTEIQLQVGAVGLHVFVNATDCRCWKAVLSGLEGQPYSGGTWMLTIDFPENYPFAAPKIRFVTPMFHPNVSSDGRVCLDILKGGWSPALTAMKVLQSLRLMVLEPNADDALDAYKGQLYNDDKAEYLRQAAKHTQEHASGNMKKLAVKFNLE
jgi:ubiquitin-conjugating enzyme E2 D/E